MNILNEYVSLYFFSAVFQGNMALLAILGVFVVFKRQELTAEILAKERIIFQLIQDFFLMRLRDGVPVPMTYAHVTELPDVLRKTAEETNPRPEVQTIAKEILQRADFNARLDEYQQLLNRRSKLASHMRVPFIWIFFFHWLFIIFSRAPYR